LQRLEDFASSKIGHRCAELLPDLTAEARRAEAKALNVLDASDLVAEPAASLRACVTRQEALNAGLIVDRVPDLLTAEVTHPAGKLARGHAVRNAGEERQAGRLVLPVIGSAVAHFSIAVDDGVESLQARHQFASRIDLDRQAATRSGGDAVC